MPAILCPGNEYTTDPAIPLSIRNYLLLGSRWSVYTYLGQAILKYRGHAINGRYDDVMWADSSLEFLHNLEKCGARFSITGLDNLRALDGPAVIIANHMSTLETLILPGLVAPIRPCNFVAKEGLVKGPIWGPVMRSRKPILVTRKDPRRDLTTVLEEGVRELSQGKSIILFPEGTRKSPFVRGEFNSLGIKLALKAGVPVIPVALKTDFWGNSPLLRGFGPIKRKKTVYISFGTPMTVSGRGKDEHEAILNFIESNLRQWGAPIAE